MSRRRVLVGAALALTLALALAGEPTMASYAADRPHPNDLYVAPRAPLSTPRPLDITHLAVGAEPAIPYAFASRPSFGDGNWQLRRPDGTTLRLPRLTWSVWAPMGDGAIGMAGTEAGPELQQVSGTGRARTRMVDHFGLAASPGGGIVAWLGDRGRPHVVEGGGTRHFTMPRVPGGRTIAAVWGIDTCQEQTPEDGGCSALVNTGRHVWVSTSHGLVDRIGPMLRVADVNQQGRLIGLVSRRTPDRRACWGVFRAGGHRVFRTCAYYLDSFSPDGRRVLAERSRVRWSSVRRFAILGRHGQVVRSWTFDPGARRSLSQLTWEDDHHLLGVLRAHGRWGIVRIGTDGTVEYAGAPVAATEEFTPYDLPRR
jgi:hypothetical protein